MPILRRALPLSLLALAACAGREARPPSLADLPAPPPVEQDVVIVRSDDPLDYRFDMEQGGRKMSADEFDAWMQSRGVRIARGAPASELPAPPRKD